MRAWANRSTEEANLLNPTFIGLLCFQVIKEYCGVTKNETPYPLPFLTIPLILYKKTRLSLPSSVRTTFVSWILGPEGTQVKARYAAHARSLTPIVKESISFAIQDDFLSITEKGNFALCSETIQLPNQRSPDFTDEVVDCFKQAGFCGRWFARAGKIETIMALLGVKP